MAWRPGMTIDDDNSVYVGGLPYDATEETVRRAFDLYGAVREVRVRIPPRPMSPLLSTAMGMRIRMRVRMRSFWFLSVCGDLLLFSACGFGGRGVETLGRVPQLS